MAIIDKLHNLNDVCNTGLLEKDHNTKCLSLSFLPQEPYSLSLSLWKNLKTVKCPIISKHACCISRFIRLKFLSNALLFQKLYFCYALDTMLEIKKSLQLLTT